MYLQLNLYYSIITEFNKLARCWQVLVDLMNTFKIHIKFTFSVLKIAHLGNFMSL